MLHMMETVYANCKDCVCGELDKGFLYSCQEGRRQDRRSNSLLKQDLSRIFGWWRAVVTEHGCSYLLAPKQELLS